YPADRTMHELFEAQAARTPDRTALICDDPELSYPTGNVRFGGPPGESRRRLPGSPGAITYRELDERANRLAHHLIAEGVRPDSVV
ncbi:AMP-binding protein, partial [Bacillus paralicheniformis]|nr:AMP-binding protein [Bacillus paralicheniformis]